MTSGFILIDKVYGMVTDPLSRMVLGRHLCWLWNIIHFNNMWSGLSVRASFGKNGSPSGNKSTIRLNTCSRLNFLIADIGIISTLGKMLFQVSTNFSSFSWSVKSILLTNNNMGTFTFQRRCNKSIEFCNIFCRGSAFSFHFFTNN